MQTMLVPGALRRATVSAAASVAPLDGPTRMPSTVASSRAKAQRFVARDGDDFVDELFVARGLRQARE
jgi:hypothetical protein